MSSHDPQYLVSEATTPPYGDNKIQYRQSHLDAIRLLYLLVAGGEVPRKPSPANESFVFVGNTRLCAFDFWMRYPDYLADELLERYENDGDVNWLTKASEIFENDEPDIRRFPMIRWHFGAYENMDDALSVLRSRDLILIGGRNTVEKILETDYLIMPSAIALCNSIETTAPPLKWYRQRAELVSQIANGRNGATLKARQYERLEYATTKKGGVIPSITDDVRRRMDAMLTEPVSGRSR